MGGAMKSRLPYRREAYRLWFEYLRVALRSSDGKVRKALRRSAAYYAPWGNVASAQFNQWWKENGYLFEEKYTVRVLTPGEKPQNPQALVLEIPLTQPRQKLIRQIRDKIRTASPQQKPVKGKMRPVTQYRLSEGAEPRLLALRETLTVYRDVYLNNRNLRGSDLLTKVHEFYLGRRRKRWAKVPTPLLFDQKYGDNAVALRNLRRYIAKAEKIVINVANGEFPGRY
jgi:hypothetical protein